MNKRLRKLINAIASRWADEIYWRYDHSEALGTVRVVRGYYGVYLGFPEIHGRHDDVCMADLYYRSAEGEDSKDRRPFAVQVYEAPDLSDPAHTFLYYAPCRRCEGEGWYDYRPGDPMECPACQGSGIDQFSKSTHAPLAPLV